MTEPEKRSETKRRRRRRRSGGGERGERRERRGEERGPFSGVRAALGEATDSDGRC